MAELPRELVDAWSSGDARAGDRLLRECRATLRQYLGARADAQLDDVVQETLIAISRCREAAAHAVSFRGYLLTTARRKLIDAARRRADGTLAEEPADQRSEPHTCLVQLEDLTALREALDQLPRALAAVLAAYYLEERTAAEIATMLEIPEGTVRTRLRRSVQLLRARLDRRPRPEAVSAALHEWAADVRTARRR